MFKLNYSETAVKNLSKLDKQVARTIIAWLSKNIDKSDDPRIYGKPLKGNLCKIWRYRIGDYRVLCLINDDELLVIAITIGHRKDIYKK